MTKGRLLLTFTQICKNPVGRPAKCYLFTQRNGLSRINVWCGTFLITLTAKQAQMTSQALDLNVSAFDDAISRTGVIFLPLTVFSVQRTSLHTQSAYSSPEKSPRILSAGGPSGAEGV